MRSGRSREAATFTTGRPRSVATAIETAPMDTRKRFELSFPPMPEFEAVDSLYRAETVQSSREKRRRRKRTSRRNLAVVQRLSSKEPPLWRSQPHSGTLENKLPIGTGGGSGIRTHDTVSRIHAFQACALNHSAIPPC